MSSVSYSKTALSADRAPAHGRRYFFIALAVMIADQISKWLVMENIALHDSVRVIPGLFQVTHIENQGAAFGLFADSHSEWRVIGLILFSLVALVVVAILLWRNSRKFSYGGVALSLILGGALGNLWDRVFDGHVIDFLDFYLGNAHWPAFNIADSAIVIGALLLVIEILFPTPAQAPARAG